MTQSGGLRPSLPSYRVRVSRRARRMQLRVLPDGEVEVVVPEGMSAGAAQAFVASKAAWIAKTRQRLAPGLSARRNACRSAPREIELAALAEVWPVEVDPGAGGRAMLRDDGDRVLRYSGPVEDGSACRRLLRLWVRERAKRVLPGWLERVSRETGLAFSRVQIRGQRSRWGSCSALGSISLNYKLLFLPQDLVRYLLIHELCHTRHLNHSPAFWALVGSHSPGHRQLDARLRRPGPLLPTWLECE